MIHNLDDLSIESGEAIVCLASAARSDGIEEVPKHAGYVVLDGVGRDARWQTGATGPRGILGVADGKRSRPAGASLNGARCTLAHDCLRKKVGEYFHPGVLRGVNIHQSN